MYAMHGCLFRDSICFLRDVFFAAIFVAGAAYTPLFLAMTATMPTTLLGPFSDLRKVDWTRPQHQLWSSAREFRQRNILMDLHVMGDITQHALPPIVSLLKLNVDAHVCVFVNFKSEAVKWARA